jgi:hypothetical protein
MALLFLAGCHQAEEPPAGPERCDHAVTAYCQKILSCNPEHEQRGLGTLEECKATDASACRLFGALKGADTRSYEYWDACNVALAALSCEDFRFGLPVEACQPHTGARALGETCVDATQCQSAYCKSVQSTESGQEWCGQCAALPKLELGATCSESAECGKGRTCSRNRCVAVSSVGAPCESTDSCYGDLVCIAGKCTKPALLGAPCTADEECGYGAGCPNGTCQAAMTAGLGMPCSIDVSCRGDTICDDTTNVCVAIKRAGAACTSDGECSSYPPLNCRNGRCVAVAEDMCPVR